MKTVKNLTTRPLRVPLPLGKVLHLGPRKSGQIAHQDLDHPPLQQLVEDGSLEVVADGRAGYDGHDPESPVHEATHGHHGDPIKKRGDR